MKPMKHYWYMTLSWLLRVYQMFTGKLTVQYAGNYGDGVLINRWPLLVAYDKDGRNTLSFELATGTKLVVFYTKDGRWGGRSGEIRRPELHMQLFGLTVKVFLPPFMDSIPLKHYYSSPIKEEAISQGREPYYIEWYKRRYGVFMFLKDSGYLHLHYGLCQGMGNLPDGYKEKTTLVRLPFTDTDIESIRYYDSRGLLFKQLDQQVRKHPYSDKMIKDIDYDLRREVEAEVPRTVFRITDESDGSERLAYTFLEEWKIVKKNWLARLICKPVTRYTLEVSYDDEVGSGKGSWKGGTLSEAQFGNPGEDHITLMNRLCHKTHRHKEGNYKLELIEVVSEGKPKPASLRW